jgi:hypothetical protein
MEVNTLHTLFDYKDGQLIYKSNRGSNKTKGNRAGWVDGVGYQTISLNGKQYREHRLIYLYHNGFIDDGLQIDHINGNKLDNRIENLRMVSHSENQWNTKSARGTSYHKRTNTWNAKIQKYGKRQSLGYYETEHEAHEAYLHAKANLHTIENRL